MAARHRHYACRIPNQFAGEGLAPTAGDIDSKIGENLDRVSARRLPRKRTESGRTHANIRATRCHFTKQSLRHRTTANVPGTNKKNIFDSAQSTQKVTRSTGQFK